MLAPALMTIAALLQAVQDVALLEPDSVQPAFTRTNQTDESPSAEVIVSGKRPQSVQKIDRRLYRIARDARSDSSDLLSLLRGLPALTIGLDDTLSLLGSPNVTILVDNKPPPNGRFVLRSLHGADIDHIEIMTNPSAEFSPEGTGGIINIVLKKSGKEGSTGSVTTQIDNFGGYQLDVTSKVRTGVWSFDTDVAYKEAIRTTRTSIDTDIVSSSNGIVTNYSEDSSWRNRSHFLMASETVGYKLGDKVSLGLDAYLGTDRVPARSRSRFSGFSPDFDSFEQTGKTHARSTSGSTTFTFDQAGSREGESTKMSLSYNLERNPSDQLQVLEYAAPVSSAKYAYSDHRNQDALAFKFDAVHPSEHSQILSYGLAADLNRSRRTQDLDNPQGIADLGPSYANAASVTRGVIAGYVSFQQPISKWTMLPALRLEAERLTGKPSSLASFHSSDVNLFPSLHLIRRLGTLLDINLSYSRRTDRPQLDQLNPFRFLTSTTTATVGNPQLKSQKTNAFEANLSYNKGGLVASAILYFRQTNRLWSTSYYGDDASLLVSRTINSGWKSDSGAEFDLNSNFGENLKVNASVNLFRSDIPVDLATNERFSEFRYTGDLTVNLKTGSRDDSKGDFQVQIKYDSHRRLYQTFYNSQLTANVSFSHSLTQKLALVVEAENALGARYDRRILDTGFTNQLYNQRSPGPRVKVRLIRNFGAAERK